jgi:uncharacterized protein (DUF952 family)
MIYKICSQAAWREAERLGTFAGAGIDLRDGYIHFSTAAQLRETADRHFSGVADLVLVAVDEQALGPNLKWESARGGDLFPHLYGALDPAAARWVKPLPLSAEGQHVFPDVGI